MVCVVCVCHVCHVRAHLIEEIGAAAVHAVLDGHPQGAWSQRRSTCGLKGGWVSESLLGAAWGGLLGPRQASKPPRLQASTPPSPSLQASKPPSLQAAAV